MDFEQRAVWRWTLCGDAGPPGIGHREKAQKVKLPIVVNGAWRSLAQRRTSASRAAPGRDCGRGVGAQARLAARFGAQADGRSRKANCFNDDFEDPAQG